MSRPRPSTPPDANRRGREVPDEHAERCEMRVGGMDCPSCAEQIERGLAGLEGLLAVHVDVVRGKVGIEYDARKLSPEDVASAIRRIGFPVESGEPDRTAFTVNEMDCAEEVRQIEEKLGNQSGVTNLKFDLLNRRVIVEGTVAASEIKRALEDLGMSAVADVGDPRSPTFWQRHGRLTMATVSGGFLATGLVLGWVGVVREVTVALLAASALAGGWFVAPRAWRAARHRALDMNFLMAIAAVGAAAIGEWAEGASVLFLYSVAQLLEVWSMDQARNAIQSLMDLSPTEATVKRNGREETVSPSDVRLEELIIVRPGQKIPLDGDVVAGGSAVNQAPITGESIPVDKAPGDQVFAGSINEHGVLEIRVTKHVEETTLARIIHAVEESQASRAPSQSFVDRFARVYTPAVVVLAGAIWLLPPVLGLGSWGVWFYRALAILVIACPCALVISTPVSVVSALTRAAREGVLAKGGLHLENTAGVTVIAFDKTGTLTEARPVVTDLVPLNDTTSEDLLRVAAALERNSEHALARAIITEADARGVESAGVSEFKALFGRGVQAIMDGKLVFLGNERLLDEHGLDQGAAEPLIRRFQSEGKTAIILFEQSGLLGVIGIADRVRPAAKACITSLRAHGIERILMLTGDNEGTARAVASNLGIDEYKSDLLPADKVNIVRRLERDGERVAFVGDGVNDAPALAAASVGIALGAAGTDVAIETADVALMGDDLAKLPFLIALSRNMLRVVKQNIVFSIVVKLVVLVLAITGWATLWMAVAADMGASILVVANGLKLLKSRNVPFIA